MTEKVLTRQSAANLTTLRPKSGLKNPFVTARNIHLRNVNLYYGDTLALNNINLDIEKNKITALIGPSGCGKSTLLRCLNRMNDQISGCRITGSFAIGDIDLYREVNVNLLRKNIGMVFQKPNVFPMSIYDNMTYGPKTFGVTDKGALHRIVEEGLKKANLWNEVKDRLKESALSLSGGQQQRLCIARCLSIDPKFVLMDEPTSALDPISTAKIEELIQELKKDYTIVIVTHNMQQAMRIADKTAYFLLGDLIEYGETDQIFKNPQKEETKKYISGVYS